MVEYGRETGKVDGYMHFRYEFFSKDDQTWSRKDVRNYQVDTNVST